MCQRMRVCALRLVAKLFKSLISGTPDFMPFLVGT
jgi:hypothetical protein